MNFGKYRRAMRSRLYRIAVLALLLSLVATACGSDSLDSVQAADAVQPAAEPAQNSRIEEPVEEEAMEEEAMEEEAMEEEAMAEESVAVETDDDPGDGLYPTVVGATATPDEGDAWRVNVTLSSTYDTPERYADAWRVLDADDNELGIRVLGHDHANEQPFTRSHTVEIPAGTTTVYIEGRDQLNGWSGERFELTLAS